MSEGLDCNQRMCNEHSASSPPGDEAHPATHTCAIVPHYPPRTCPSSGRASAIARELVPVNMPTSNTRLAPAGRKRAHNMYMRSHMTLTRPALVCTPMHLWVETDVLAQLPCWSLQTLRLN